MPRVNDKMGGWVCRKAYRYNNDKRGNMSMDGVPRIWRMM